MMRYTIEHNGRRFVVEAPDEASALAVVEGGDAPAPAAAPAPAPAPAAPPSMLSRIGNYAEDTAAIGLRGARRGVASLAGAPVDIVNAIMGAVGLPTSDKPFMGSRAIDEAMALPSRAIAPALGVSPERATEGPTPQDAVQRVVGRVGQEIGANVLPVMLALRGGATVGAAGARAMQNQGVGKGILGKMYETAAVNPTGFARRELGYAGAAGTGAGIANELAGNPQTGDNFWSDTLGSIAGTVAASTLGGVAQQGANVVNAVTGKPVFNNNVAREAVATDIMANSTRLQDQFSQRGSVGAVDTTDIVRDLRRPSAAEELVPGFRSDIADRAQDPGLSTFSYNRASSSPGALNARRTNNNAAISESIAQMDPAGDPAQLRAALEADRMARIAAAEAEAEKARLAFEAATRDIQPNMADATARGSSVRAALADSYEAAKQRVREAYAPINDSTVPVDAAPLADNFAATRDNLPLNDQQRFLPSEANVPAQLVTPAQPAQPSAILGPDGSPIMKPEVPASGVVPLRQITALRSGLTDNIRAANATPGQARKAHVDGQFLSDVEKFLDESVPAEVRAQYDAANAARRDVADRFERPGTAIAETLQRREGGGYQLDDSAVPTRYTPTDQGRVTDFRDAMREAGTDPRLRDALSDEILSQANRANVVGNTRALDRWLSDRSIVLENFPELRDKLKAAGAAAETAGAATKSADTVRRDLTTPSRSPEARYLQYGNEATVDAVRSVTTSATPADDMRRLIESAGGTPQARQNARSALWEVVKTKKDTATDMTGADRWNVRKLNVLFNDPKFAAAAKEAWADNPEHLENIKNVFDALARVGRTEQARVPGSSGTAQQLFRPGFDARSISSSLRSVNQGRSSILSELLYQTQGRLRQKNMAFQSKAIDELTNKVINDPDLAADLLAEFNPADFAAKSRMISQKYGLRNTVLFNLLDENEDPDNDVKSTIMRDREGANAR